MDELAELLLLLVFGLCHLVWRFRTGLAPFVFVLAVLGVTEILFDHIVVPWWLPLLTGSALGTSMWFGGPRIADLMFRLSLFLNPQKLDDGSRSFLLRDRARLFGSLVCVVVGTWVSYRLQNGWTEATRDTLLFALLGFALPWWHYHGWRRRRPMNRYALRWSRIANSELAELRGWQHSRVVKIEGSRTNPVLVVRLRGGRTIRAVSQTAANVCSAQGLRPGAVTIMPDPTAEARVRVRIVPRDPWTGVLMHPLPAVDSLRLSEHPRVNMGRYEDAENVLFKLQQHTLVVGRSGSGKSVWLESLLAWILAYEDAIAVAADLASGATFGVWEDVFAAPLATTVSEAEALIMRIFAEITYRERLLAQRKKNGELIDTLPVSTLFPAIFCFIDEFPDLVKAAGPKVLTLIERFAAKGRKVEVWLVLGSQNPTEKDVGSTELRGQMTGVVGLGLSNQQSRTLWGSMREQGWDSKPLLNGTFLLNDNDREHQEPRVAKGLWIPPAERLRLIRSAKYSPDALNPTSRGILIGNRIPEVAGPAIPPGSLSIEDQEPQSVTATVVDVQVRRTAAEMDELVYTALPTEGGIGPGEIMQATELERDMVNRTLRRLQRLGRVNNPKHGKWVKV